MASKNILTLNGHPAESSLSASLLDRYQENATKAGHLVRRHDLFSKTFDPDFGDGGYHNPKPLEPDLQTFVDDLLWCDHLVLATPMWWGGLPALLKGLFDRALLPGTTFDTRNTNFIGMPAPLLKGRTASTLLTSDTPSYALSLMYGSAIRKQLERQIYKFVGLKPVSFKSFAPATEAKPALVNKWLNVAGQLGAAAR
ncbi:NAD(P)H-dependent oxidoreductase [Sneathiella limimaris]|uniref:NAD(P)H-dependent oxidoreductase n=1 Tax=Sneathiella limimaris TaxID=1964213 RepID=UPI00146B3CAD|nr:NAD(P)H-dependent oxidoreductase [Sneathiella limimaris]